MKICLKKSLSDEFVHTTKQRAPHQLGLGKPRFDSQEVTIPFIYSIQIYKVPIHYQLPLAAISRFKIKKRNLASLEGPPSPSHTQVYS